ncbi:MAG: hypothetical protein ACI92S_001499 [Planctomycetaceae bacterium]|jgi:hypothetical protein
MNTDSKLTHSENVGTLLHGGGSWHRASLCRLHPDEASLKSSFGTPED